MLKKENALFATEDEKEALDERLLLKKTTFLKDSFRRFVANKASVVAFFIILLILLYSIIGSLSSPYSYIDSLDYNIDGPKFALCLPKAAMFEGTGFWDGTQTKTVNESTYQLYLNYDSERKPIVKDYGEVKQNEEDSIIYGAQKLYQIQLDSYAVGSYMINLEEKDLSSLLSYQEKEKVSIIQPIVNYESYLSLYQKEMEDSNQYTDFEINRTIETFRKQYNNNANIYYEIDCLKDNRGHIKNSNVFFPVYEGDKVKSLYEEPIALEDGRKVDAIYQNGSYRVRVDFYNYFIYKYHFEPMYLFGSNSAGLDLFSRLAKGTLFSLALGVIVSLVNLVLGLIYGAIQGYYGGKTDLIMDRASEILSALPSTILLVVFNVYFKNVPGINQALAIVLGLFIAFIITGWIGTSSTTRRQFYRFKNQEYVLASRSLGAKDSRLIFRHILPNAIGTLITSSILMIPGVIFSESSLSYLGIIDFSGSGIASIGQLLNEGNNTLGTSEAFLLLFPSIIVSLLMISFNLFGNGLRDAFNTNMRGEK